MEKTAWKIIAIIFIILFLLETIFIFGMASLVTDYIIEDTECSTECFLVYEAEYYEYDNFNKTCSCYDSYGELISTPLI